MGRKLKGSQPAKITSIRLDPQDKVLLIKLYGSVQKAMDAILVEIKKVIE